MAEVPVIITLGGQKFVYTADMKVLLLTRLTSGSAKSLRGENDVDYQVPVGKVARILSVTFVGMASGSNAGKIYDEATANTATGANRLCEVDVEGTTAVIRNECSYDIAATRYIGCDSSGSTGVTCVALEMDA
tara:strand:+ start:301 stop:699 length:399 start_codon:yes stop_codon:yes gene_type:complete